jgi:hypothetical protein
VFDVACYVLGVAYSSSLYPQTLGDWDPGELRRLQEAFRIA